MTLEEKKQFVRDLCKSVSKELEAKIDSGKIPAHWDGHELRALMAEKFIDNAAHSIIKLQSRGRRARDYRNTVIVNYL